MKKKTGKCISIELSGIPISAQCGGYKILLCDAISKYITLSTRNHTNHIQTYTNIIYIKNLFERCGK